MTDRSAGGRRFSAPKADVADYILPASTTAAPLGSIKTEAGNASSRVSTKDAENNRGAAEDPVIANNGDSSLAASGGAPAGAPSGAPAAPAGPAPAAPAGPAPQAPAKTGTEAPISASAKVTTKTTGDVGFGVNSATAEVVNSITSIYQFKNLDETCLSLAGTTLQAKFQVLEDPTIQWPIKEYILSQIEDEKNVHLWRYCNQIFDEFFLARSRIIQPSVSATGSLINPPTGLTLKLIPTPKPNAKPSP
jgi:hypothetical protein